MFLWLAPKMDNKETDTETVGKCAIKAIRAQNIFTHIYVDNLNNKKNNEPPYAVICINKKRPQNANGDRFVAVAAVIPQNVPAPN